MLSWTVYTNKSGLRAQRWVIDKCHKDPVRRADYANDTRGSDTLYIPAFKAA